MLTFIMKLIWRLHRVPKRLKQLNQWYNDGLITTDFPTDTTEDVMKADVANGRAGFVLDDLTQSGIPLRFSIPRLVMRHLFLYIALNIPDSTCRNPFEYRYAMFVMVPSTTKDEKLDACMMYLNWLADPENAKLVRYTPDLIEDENGVAIEPAQEVKDEKGYPGTCDDLCIMNLNFDWVNDPEVLAPTDLRESES